MSPLRGLIGLTLVLCSWVLAPSARVQAQVVSGDDFEGALLDGKQLYYGSTGYEVDAWEVSEDDVVVLEAALEAFLETHADPSAAILLAMLPDYTRQYGGVMLDEEPCIYVNFFCSHDDGDWATTPVTVDDGGTCYFQVLYHPASGTFTDLSINGSG